LKEEVGLILGKGVTEREGLKMCIDFWINSAYDTPMFSKLAEFLFSKDRFLQHLAAIGIRKLLSAGKLWKKLILEFLSVDAPIGTTIDSGIVPRLISMLEMEEEPHLQVRKCLFQNRSNFVLVGDCMDSDQRYIWNNRANKDDSQ